METAYIPHRQVTLSHPSNFSTITLQPERPHIRQSATTKSESTLTGPRTTHPPPLSGQPLQRRIATRCTVVTPWDHWTVAVSTEGMIRRMSAYEDLRAVIFGQVIKAWFATPASGVSVSREKQKRRGPGRTYSVQMIRMTN